MINAIAAVSKNYGIGANGDLLYNIPEDKKFFRSMTKGRIVVMGRKTLESLPGGKPLPDRINIVLSSNKSFMCDGVTVCHSFDGLKEEIKKYPPEDVFVCGGADVYKLLLPLCGRAYITHIEDEKYADRFFPEIDKLPEWKLTEQTDIKEYNGLKYSFCTYEKIY